MKKSALAFKFGQNKTAKQTYFPSVSSERSGAKPNFTAAKKSLSPGDAPSRTRPVGK